jgi:2,3-bisphosphoglycerate-independent phosphoglycerate mutase
MKYIVLVPDGMADYPVEILGHKTPLEVARTDNMDYLAQNGLVGLVQTIPDQMPSGSDVANLAILGYDPHKHFSGRAPLEAANLGIILQDDEVAFRCNLVTVENDQMADYSAGHISSKEAALLIKDLNKKFQSPTMKFYAGKSYRHLLIIKSPETEEFLKTRCVAPHDISGQKITSYWPQGSLSDQLRELMEKSKEVLASHPVNQVRIDLKENPANMIWLWGQGKRPQFSSFKEKFGLEGSIISAVDLINGIGRLIGLEVIKVPGITGYYDTNYAGKARYALRSLKVKDFVFIHVEATDEAGHNGDIKMKMACIEHIDKEIVGTILEYYRHNTDMRLLVLPDHATPVEKRSHVADPVGFVMFGKGIRSNGASEYNERTAQEKGLKFQRGEEMLEFFLSKQ